MNEAIILLARLDRLTVRRESYAFSQGKIFNLKGLKLDTLPKFLALARWGLSLVLAASCVAKAQTTAPEPNSITQIGTGWGCDCFGINVDRPVVNPANCPNTDGYMSDSSSGGMKTHYAAALLAYGMGRRIRVTVHNNLCVHGRPAILGLTVVQ